MAKKSVKLPRARNPLAAGVMFRPGAGVHEKSKKVLRRNNKMNLRGEWMKKSSVPLEVF